MKCTSVFKLAGLFVFLFGLTAFAGNLEPMGPPASTMKPLDQVEPRIPIVTIPFTITQSGSYYLVSNLNGTSGSNGITIDANNVSIDLRGFALIGKAESVNGITVNAYKHSVSIRNGTVTGWGGGNGVQCWGSDNCIITNIRAFNNFGYGIAGGAGTTITNCSAISNGNGIGAGDNSIISNCASTNNGGSGFNVLAGSTVTNCTAANNNYGFTIGTDSVITGCTANNNDTGISATRCRIDGCVANYNRINGIYGGYNSLISSNLCIGNGANPDDHWAGISVASGCHVENNNVIGNEYGIQATSSGNVIIKNRARGNTTNDYQIAAGSTYGAIINMTAGGQISSDDPWANLRY